MGTIVRRFLVLFAFLFWQGGFLFYSAVVIHVGQNVLPPPARQSQITMPVTRCLNLIGVVTLVALAVDVFLTRDESRQKAWRWLCWLLMASGLAGLLWLHPRLVDFMEHHDQPGFYPLHRAYLLTSTVQWFAAMAFLLLTLLAWRAVDRPVISASAASG